LRNEPNRGLGLKSFQDPHAALRFRGATAAVRLWAIDLLDPWSERAATSTPAARASSSSPRSAQGALQNDEIVRKAVFGPVVSVTRFDDVDQAVA
jgi:hypothetical protein